MGRVPCDFDQVVQDGRRCGGRKGNGESVLGQGHGLFPNAGPDIALELVDSRADSKGVTIQVYRPTGGPWYATATADHDDA
jgi:hypothetical protein